MMMLVLTVCSFEGTWNIDRNEEQCESTVFLCLEKKHYESVHLFLLGLEYSCKVGIPSYSDIA